MQVKIGNKIFDSNDEPIMLILTDQDKRNVANMDPKAHHLASFPESMSREEAEKFMDSGNYDLTKKVPGA